MTPNVINMLLKMQRFR